MKMKHLAKQIVIFVIVISSAINLAGCSFLQSFSTAKEQNGELLVHFLNVGSADAILVECDNEFMMVDCGSDKEIVDYSTYKIDNYLKEKNVEEFKYIFITHPDEDHYRGLTDILQDREYDAIFCSKQEKDTVSFNKLKNEVETMFKKIQIPKEGKIYKLGGATVEVLSVKPEESDNDSSIVLMVEYKNTRVLLTGDAENTTENYLRQYKDIKCDVLKAAHHGSSTSSRSSFLEKANPKWIVVSSSENDGGSTFSRDLIDYVSINGAKILYTWEQGTIVCRSDGKDITFENRDRKQLSANY